MSAEPVFTRVLRRTATGFPVAIIVALSAVAAPSAQAAPLAAAFTSLGTLEPQLALASPATLPAAPNLSRYARMKRMHSHMMRMRRAKAARAARIRNYRSELAHAERLGPFHCLATAVYFEARDEPVRGQKAVAAVIMQRARTPGRPKTICGVVFEGAWRKTGCQFSFACDGRPDIPHWRERWIRAKASAASVWDNQKRSRWLARGATFYHATYVRPRWARRMVRVMRIGLHVFYRPRHGHLS